jgi:oxygen-independent coproporphyrinogen-3 oxidase
MMKTASLYLHFPFCLSKCAYCDFNSQVADPEVRATYLAALLQDLPRSARLAGQRLITSVYFGGGTPTLYPAEDLCRVLGSVRQHFALAADTEVTIEANPATVGAEGLALLRESGCNRLSLGVQSFSADELQLLGRAHTAAEARQAVAQARAAGFENLSLDLINALPGQTAGQWLASLQQALQLQPEHLSCYGLSLEPGTPLAARVSAGELTRPPEDDAVALYELTHELATEAGYEHYEIANYARPGRRCRHSENYWRNGEYVGVGAGAWSYLSGRRFRQEPDPLRWAERVALGLPPAVVEEEKLPRKERAAETLMLALRTADGVDLAAYCRQFRLDPERFTLRRQALIEAGLARDLDGHLALDPVRGFLLQSEIAQMFL